MMPKVILTQNLWPANASIKQISKLLYGYDVSGNNSVVLGKHAHVLHKTGRYATLFGYVAKHTR
jgi:hypothetical protein